MFFSGGVGTAVVVVSTACQIAVCGIFASDAVRSVVLLLLLLVLSL